MSQENPPVNTATNNRAENVQLPTDQELVLKSDSHAR